MTGKVGGDSSFQSQQALPPEGQKAIAKPQNELGVLRASLKSPESTAAFRDRWQAGGGGGKGRGAWRRPQICAANNIRLTINTNEKRGETDIVALIEVAAIVIVATTLTKMIISATIINKPTENSLP